MTQEPASATWPRAMGKVAPAAFAHHGIHRLEDLVRYTEKELLAIHGVGPKAIRVAREALADRGLAFREPDAAG
jgi:hypothetical protein